MQIRPEQPADQPAIRSLNVAAFDTPAEANLVDALREQAQPVISLVADDSGTVVGHIMFSPVTIPAREDLKLMGLAPMAVAPKRQRQGIGSALVRSGLDRCRQLGIAAVVVLGHPEYYPRFGFEPSGRFGISCEYDVPADVFMVLELISGCLKDASGQASYHAAFGNL
jgi:putative acetyltransferase